LQYIDFLKTVVCLEFCKLSLELWLHHLTAAVLTLFCTMIPYGVMRLSASLCQFRQCPLEIGYVWTEMGGTGGGGWVQPKGANSMAVSGRPW